MATIPDLKPTTSIGDDSGEWITCTWGDKVYVLEDISVYYNSSAHPDDYVPYYLSHIDCDENEPTLSSDPNQALTYSSVYNAWLVLESTGLGNMFKISKINWGVLHVG